VQRQAEKRGRNDSESDDSRVDKSDADTTRKWLALPCGWIDVQMMGVEIRE